MTTHASSERTKGEILRAARELFAERDFCAVTVRDIAARAGVNHALVHRYFGTKEEMVGEILRREVVATGRMSPPAGSDLGASLDGIRRILDHTLGEGRATLQLIVRAEIAGLHPETMLADDARPLGMMADWIAQRQRESGRTGAPDPALVSAVVGAAMLALVDSAPWVMSAVGCAPEDYESRRGEILDILMGLIAEAAR